MINLFDLEPQYTPAFVQKTLSDWAQSIARWNSYRELRKNHNLGHWRAVCAIASEQGCTNQNIIISLDRVKKQIFTEHPELSLKGGDEPQ